MAMTLQDLLLGMGGPRAHFAPTGSPAGIPSAASPAMSPTELAIEQEIQAQSQPEPFTPEAVPDKAALWQKILGGLADAGTTYASGLNPWVRPTGALGSLLQGDLSRQEIIQRNAAGGKTAEYRSRMKASEQRLRQLMQKQSEETAAKAKGEAKAEAAALRSSDIQREKARFDIQRQDRLAEQDRDEAFRQSQASWQKQVDQSLIDARRREKEDPDEKPSATDKKTFQEELDLLDATVQGTGKGDSLEELLASGDTDPDQVEQILLTRIRRSTLPRILREKYADEVDRTVGAIINRHRSNAAISEASADLSAGSPQKSFAQRSRPSRQVEAMNRRAP